MILKEFECDSKELILLKYFQSALLVLDWICLYQRDESKEKELIFYMETDCYWGQGKIIVLVLL